MNHPMRHCLLVALCGLAGYWVHAGDQPAGKSSPPAKDVICQTTKKGADCHSPGSRAAVLKDYLAQQEKTVTSQTSTNGVKPCDKPPSRAELMQQKTGPTQK